jgi:hypothetical protein
MELSVDADIAVNEPCGVVKVPGNVAAVVDPERRIEGGKPGEVQRFELPMLFLAERRR